ncbi:hypothetical protein H9X85_04620 [Anaerotignum lactatifermentans]|uniref:Membrane fusion protein biotin-lipoyl like domain-containing protein n=1 Tax=Anaerotignum lactatifermentans TaxID=160404 RepID=A0ABS2G6X1_9FIRM|nr:HlyD family efflux transporter periplasmic adaptor subunit [Anaerotignum lactatifermentans]MBM6828891.1 hypothetical protein [Anaerotignum lactatifermentans]MBM6876935.1 hypothetical protein [Anaerotignum lactatifermentans]MBM6950494.1 hypothetical protein [Anaerotignum lactatifermentans]
MKKGSSGNRKKRLRNQEPNPARRQYPSRDNVYELKQYQQRAREKENRRYRPAQQQVRTVSAPKHRTHAKKRRNVSGRVLPMFVFLVIALYLVGQIFTMAVRKPEVGVETVTYGSIDTPESFQGLIVRDEVVVTSNRAGTPFYQYAEGDNVKKSAVVCSIKDTASTDVLEDKLANIDADILESQKERADLSAFAEDIQRLENTMKSTVDSFAGKSMSESTSYLYSMRTQLESSINQRNEIWLSENVESLSQLNEEKNAYEQQLSQSMSNLTAPESGVLAFTYDGLEETLTPEAIPEISVDQISGNEKMTSISKVSNVVEGDPVFRLVTSNRWYIITSLPASDVADWEVNTWKKINLIGEEGTYQATATVESVEKGESQSRVVLSCNSYLNEFINNRLITIQLDSTVVEGLKIPNNAIVEKSMLKIPVECLTESGGNQGFLLVNGSNSKFVSVQIVSSDESYCYIEQDNGSIALGDVILQGTGETAVEYTVSEVATSPGVYVANSSMAKFASIRILEQNQEFAIVESATTYGLQAYDTIVSDAKNITEGQSIY